MRDISVSHLPFILIIHMLPSSLDLESLCSFYSNGGSPLELFNYLYQRILSDGNSYGCIWIHLRPLRDILDFIDNLPPYNNVEYPLWGVPFSVKDNIDVALLPTTAACPSFSYLPKRSAHVVSLLEEAGAICFGKTNLDQFATGLNGTRSPYGFCSSAFNAEYIAGGSSSGSAVSVSLQHVSFSIGTDTGGSGRIPAALNNIVGLKPTCGTLSSNGLVPCCPSIDCPSIFALSVSDASHIASIMHRTNISDPTLRDRHEFAEFSSIHSSPIGSIFHPFDSDLEFFGNTEGQILYLDFLASLRLKGLNLSGFDFSPLLEAGSFLFDGAFLADRLLSIGSVLNSSNHPDVLETTTSIVSKAESFSGSDVFSAFARLKIIQAYSKNLLRNNNIFIFPTVAPLYTVDQVVANPVDLNTNIGHYSYFANVLDLSALSVPIGFYSNGMPFGVTLMALPFQDCLLSHFAQTILNTDLHPLGKSRI